MNEATKARISRREKTRIIDLARYTEAHLRIAQDVGRDNRHGRQHAGYAEMYSVAAFRIAQGGWAMTDANSAAEAAADARQMALYEAWAIYGKLATEQAIDGVLRDAAATDEMGEALAELAPVDMERLSRAIASGDHALAGLIVATRIRNYLRDCDVVTTRAEQIALEMDRRD